MKTVYNLAEIENIDDIDHFEQEIEIRFQNDWYTLILERDIEGNISEVIKEAILEDFVNQDVEGHVISVIADDADIWYDLDQLVFDADEGEIIEFSFDLFEFLHTHFFDDDEIEYLKDKENGGYIDLEIRITENRIY